MFGETVFPMYLAGHQLAGTAYTASFSKFHSTRQWSALLLCSSTAASSRVLRQQQPTLESHGGKGRMDSCLQPVATDVL